MTNYKYGKLWLVLATLLLLGSMLVACGGQEQATEAPAEEAPAAEEEAPAEEEMAEEEMAEEEAPAAEEEAAAGPFTIGVSNGFVGSEWRTQMIQDLEEVNAEFMEQGLTNELIIESADVDVQGQTQQIQNLINRGVDAIIINPNDQNALNPIIQEAVDAGIVVIAVDQQVSAEQAINVVIDQKEWAKISARWLMEQLGGQGDIVLIEGVVGHPANENRMAGVEEVLADNPDVEVVARDSANWDQATGQQVMSDFLASVPNIDGVWTQDGMAEGALRAINTANPDEWPEMSGEARAGYIKLWNEIKQERPEFTSVGVVNPPGVGASGLRVAVELLQGREMAEGVLGGPFNNTLFVPIPGAVDEANFQAVYEAVQDLPDSYTLDGMINQEQAVALITGEVTAADLRGQIQSDIPEPSAILGREAEAAATEEAEMAEEEAAMPEGAPFTIGVSNGFVGSEWRTQMIQDMEAINADYMDQGLTEELIIESADVDVQGQTQQIQNLINRGVDAIIINPNDQNALNPIIQEAVDAGIVVIAVDQQISAENALNVVIDQNEWAQISARWLMEQLGGQGDIVLIEGVVGHPANENRMAGVETVLSNNPDVEVVARDSANWDQATGQQVMSDFMASIPNIDGIWTQDGMAEGALRAVNTANPDEWPTVSGEARAGYIKLWNEIKQERPEFTSVGVVNPPGVGASGLRVAVELLSGRELAEGVQSGQFNNTLFVPIPGQVTEENFQEIYEQVQDLPDSYTLDGIISRDQAIALMSGEATAEDLEGEILIGQPE